jgi:hypothetical protein
MCSALKGPCGEAEEPNRGREQVRSQSDILSSCYGLGYAVWGGRMLRRYSSSKGAEEESGLQSQIRGAARRFC